MSEEQVRDAEKELLKEYKDLSNKLDEISKLIEKLNQISSQKLIEELRSLEQKTALIFTLMKASVYSIFLQESLAAEQ